MYFVFTNTDIIFSVTRLFLTESMTFSYQSLVELEEKDPSSVVPDSPTQRVAKGYNSFIPIVQHLVPMLSLENSYNAEDLMDFDRKARELSGKDL